MGGKFRPRSRKAISVPFVGKRHKFVPRIIGRGLKFETLENRLLLAADFGDAPAPYPTLLANNGAYHEAVGPILGAQRDTEANGIPSALAKGDDTNPVGSANDEDGLTFGAIHVGQLGATVT